MARSVVKTGVFGFSHHLIENGAAFVVPLGLERHQVIEAYPAMRPNQIRRDGLVVEKANKILARHPEKVRSLA
jgi:hypothetical protein